jgi:hypothetical protein
VQDVGFKCGVIQALEGCPGQQARAAPSRSSRQQRESVGVRRGLHVRGRASRPAGVAQAAGSMHGWCGRGSMVGVP